MENRFHKNDKRKSNKIVNYLHLKKCEIQPHFKSQTCVLTDCTYLYEAHNDEGTSSIPMYSSATVSNRQVTCSS